MLFREAWISVSGPCSPTSGSKLSHISCETLSSSSLLFTFCWSSSSFQLIYFHVTYLYTHTFIHIYIHVHTYINLLDSGYERKIIVFPHPLLSSLPSFPLYLFFCFCFSFSFSFWVKIFLCSIVWSQTFDSTLPPPLKYCHFKSKSCA